MNKFDQTYNKIIKEEYNSEEEVFERYLDKINFRYEDYYQLQQIIEILGYRQGFQEFFADNPGATEKIIEFISEWTPKNREWTEAFQDELDELEEDEEGSEDEEDKRNEITF